MSMEKDYQQLIDGAVKEKITMREPLTTLEKRKLKKQYYLARRKLIKEARERGEKIVEKEFKKAKPWYVHWDAAHTRCTNPKAINYNHYGAKGIKFEMTVEDVKYLWILDKADQQKRPSLDRIDSSKNYTFENCRFIELDENSARANRGKKRVKHDKDDTEGNTGA